MKKEYIKPIMEDINILCEQSIITESTMTIGIGSSIDGDEDKIEME